MVRTLRRGRGRNPYIDSTVKLRLKITVNDKVIVNNYPETHPNMLEAESKEEQPYDFHDSEDLRTLTDY